VAKKRRQEHNPPKPKEFHVTPFGILKGVSVADEVPVQPLKPITKKTVAVINDGQNLFLQEMADVRPFHPAAKKPAPAGSHPLQKTAKKVVEELKIAEEKTFMQEISRLKLDTKFTDSVPDDGEMQTLSGNRLRQVKRGIVSVEYQLDLHGLTRDEALGALTRFLRSARQKNQKAALIITGKGNHSPDEPVLHQAVASWLRDAGREHILEFAPAPRELGGSGAYVVFLRPPQHVTLTAT
jgi:DNA-nicking Smr family endonuclease